MECSIHDVKEERRNKFGVISYVYPYRCSRCKRCFLCAHQLEGYSYWICADGYKKPTTMDPGVEA